MAPELVRKCDYDGSKVDMWALGVLLFTLLIGAFPFRGNSEHELYSRIMRGWYKFPQGVRISKEAKCLIQKCLQIDPSKRMDAA
jgi:serine/threonine protein kinase